jgi:hypothetical protein
VLKNVGVSGQGTGRLIIIILVFSVNVTVLYGDQPLPNSLVTFSMNWFKHEDLEYFQDFIEVYVIV